MAYSVTDPNAQQLTLSGPSAEPVVALGSAVGIFTVTNNPQVFGASGPAQDTFAGVVVDQNNIVVATPASWPDYNLGSFGLPSGYTALNPDQVVYLNQWAYGGYAVTTTAIPPTYAGQTLTIAIMPTNFIEGATIGQPAPWQADAWLSATFPVAANDLGPSITESSLPGGQVGTSYSTQLGASGGILPYAWSSTGGMAPGLSLSPDGVLSGTPTAAGIYSITVACTDAEGIADHAVVKLSIVAAVQGGGGGGSGSGSGSGTLPTNGSVQTSFWASLSTTEKALVIGGGAALLIGGSLVAFGGPGGG